MGINGAQAASSANYGSTVLSLNTPYEAVIKWNFISGVLNDPLTLYVNPTDSILTNNPVYATRNWDTTEPTTVAGINLRIGGATTTPGVLVDSIEVTEVLAVPEPTTSLLSALGATMLLLRRRRK
jgi:hypothetical protein